MLKCTPCRWNAIKTEKAKFQPSYPFLIPRPYDCLYDFPDVLKGKGKASHVNCQVLRSCSSWSAGIDDVESSIHSALTWAISEAEHYVYIENQGGGDPRTMGRKLSFAMN